MTQTRRGTEMRNIFVSTSIAETFLTRDEIVYVVDLGFFTQKFYNLCTRFESLFVSPISKLYADQRAGHTA
ncbi:hypothetical protein Bca4012_049203 [Brassica carinata]|uniref:RNA helicase n=1 Tax=Brassica carinata TaxID=52824 RepID=A0A8X7R197_BRACI|nr:hypothetical protein Bca52824_051998 [Brassica carinata]